MKTGKIIWGLVFVSIGSALLLSNLGIIYFHWRSIWQFWPVIFVLMGVNMLFSRSNSVVGIVLAISILISVLVCIGYKGARVNKDFSHRSNNEQENSPIDGSEDVFSEPYLSKTDKAQLNINGGAASYYLADTTNNLFDAAIEQGYGNYILEKTSRNSTEILNFRMRSDEDGWGTNHSNDVKLKLNRNPFWDIYVEVGAGKTDFDLRKFKVEKLTLKGGAASFNVKLGISQSSSSINVDAGVAKVDIQVPLTSACRIHLDNGLCSKKLIGFTKQKDGTYVSDQYSTQTPQKIDINLKGGLAKFEVSRY